MKRNTLFMMLLISVSHVSAQEYIYISESGIRDFLRVNAGFTQWSLAQKDSAAKSAMGIHLSNEVKIVSGLWDKERAITFHDAFYFDMNMGRMNNEARTTISGDDNETRFSLNINMGYLILAGYRQPKWAALAGVDFRWRSASVGDLKTPDLNGNLFNYSRPLVLRGEYCLSDEIADKRAIAMLWYDKGSATRTNYFSFRGEYPLGKGGRWWLCFQYTYQKSMLEDTFQPSVASEGSFNQFMLGFRVQNALL